MLIELFYLILFAYGINSLNPCSNGICSLSTTPLIDLLLSAKSLNPCSNGICSLRSVWKPLVISLQGMVLILVLMEYAHWALSMVRSWRRLVSLNPCSNGICSLRTSAAGTTLLKLSCLNPCSNGICSLRDWEKADKDTDECGLNPCSNGICSLRAAITAQGCYQAVLILVLMEYAHWDFTTMIYFYESTSLNPCSNGICSLRCWEPWRCSKLVAS